MKKVVIAIFALGAMYWPLATNAQSFTEISASLTEVYYSDGTWGDYDDDGDLDIVLTGWTGSTRVSEVYQNDGGNFVNINAPLTGVYYGSVAWGDYDNDEDLDILLMGFLSSSRVYRNDNGSFTNFSSLPTNTYLGSADWGDYDNDGDLDILMTGNSSGYISKIYRNDSGSFVDISASLTAVYSSSAAWGDYDNDGDLDILLSGQSSSGYISKIYRNDEGSFVDISASLTAVYSSSAAWGDYDNDGDLDILLTGNEGTNDSPIPISKIYRNDGGSFVDISASLTGIWDGSVAWGDYDNDGDLDILLTGKEGNWDTPNPSTKVYRNDGGSFVDISASLAGVHEGSVSWGDYDNDGDLDIFLTGNGGNWNSPIPITKIYRNEIETANTIPTVPVNLVHSGVGNSVTLNWDKGTDNETEQNGLTYNLRLGTTSGRVEKISPMAEGSTGYRKIPMLGNTNHNNSWTIISLPAGTYYWSVQTIDNAFAGSGFAVEQSFTLSNGMPTLQSISQDSGYRQQTLDVVLTGTNFMSGITSVSFGSEVTVNTATVNSWTQLTVNITISSDAVLGARDVSVTNAPPGGGTATLTNGFTVNEPPFTDISASLAEVYESSVAWGDYDNDGDLDILLTGRTSLSPYYFRTSKIYRNDSELFVDMNASLSQDVLNGSVAWGDYDNDGDLDILLTGNGIAKIYQNEGGSFIDISASLGALRETSVAWGDYDNDGDLDILIIGYSGSSHSKVYRNDEGNFVDIAASLVKVYAGSVAWGDYDNDGDLDILLTGQSTSKIYRNDDGSFVDINAPLTGVWYSSVAWGDYDDDGDLDVLLTGSYYSGSWNYISKVYRNDGGSFTDISTTLIGVGSSSVAWGDYDNDGDLDVLLTGYSGSTYISKVYRNDGGSFTDILAPLIGVSNSSAAWGDYDNDGDLDVLLTGYTGSTRISKIYRNNVTTFNTIPIAPNNLTSSVTGNSVTLSWGKSTDNETSQSALTYNIRLGSNSGGVDAVSPMADGSTGYRRVPTLGNTNHNNSWTINNLPGGTHYWSVQAIDNAFAGSGFAAEQSFTFNNAAPTLSSISPTIGHRGQTVDVVFTGTNFLSEVTSVSFGADITVNSTTVNSSTQLTANITIASEAALGARDISITNAPPGGGTATLTNGFTVNETPFTDISASLTGVYASSVAWGDYDNDGDLDILMTGDRGTGFRLTKVYRNDSGSFFDISAPSPPITGGSASWGDYDNDGDLDALLTGGGYSYVYRNDAGSFVNTSASLPGVYYSSSAWGDYDNDGDLDILLTGTTNGSSSGRISRIYRNDDGSFISATSLYNVYYGSVAWGDYENDGDLDILLTGYTGSSRIAIIYQNNNGSFSSISTSLAGVSDGSVAWGDYDSDGDLDILLTGYSNSGYISKVYRNDRGSFVDIVAPLTNVASSSVVWGDYDNDGDLDILLTGNTGSSYISEVYRNDNGNFVDVYTSLFGVRNSSVAWGDYDNDGDLDILLTGYTGSSYISNVYRNNSSTPNTIPSSPTNLTYSVSGSSVTLNWGKSTDNETGQNGLTYNIRLGTTSGGVEKVSPMADGSTGYRRVPKLGNTNHNNSWTIGNLPGGTYYWSAQAIDNAFAGSGFAAEQSFTFDNSIPTLTSISPDSGYREYTLDVVFTGTNFLSGVTSVDFGADITVNSTAVSSSTQLTANITIGASAATGLRDVSVINAAPGGGIITLSDGFKVIQPSFTDINANITGISGGSIAWGDYDSDGDLDVLLTGYPSSGSRISKVYQNDSGSYMDIGASLMGVDRSSVAWGDYDNDGDLDILLAGYTGSARIAKIYQNDAGSFVDISASLTGAENGVVTWGDYDNDGDLDILLTGYNPSYRRISKVFRNDSGTFVDVGASLAGVNGSSGAWGDYDNDGDLDILLTGYTGSSYISKVYRNDSGGFVDISASLSGVTQSSVAWGDYDSDGDLDILLTGQAWGGSRISNVYRNDSGSFVDISASLTGVDLSSVAWGDYDNDGDLDILLTGTTNGYSSGRVSKVYRNDDGTFVVAGAALMAFIRSSAAFLSGSKVTQLSAMDTTRISNVYWKETDGLEDVTVSTTRLDDNPVIQGNYAEREAKVDDIGPEGKQYNVSDFVEMASPITGVYYSSVAWGDHDNDGDLDFLLTGYTGSEYVSEVYRNNIETSNTIPGVPTNLSSSVSGNSVTLSWDKSTDNETTQNGLTYNLRLGTTSGGVEKVSPMADGSTGYRKVPKLGNTTHNNSWIIANLPGGTYYWSAQAVDNAFAGSGFATEQSFIVINLVPTLTSVSSDSGYRGTSLNVVFTGTNFMSGVTSVSFGADITVNSTTVNSPTQLTTNITIDATAALGARDVSVTNASPGGGTATLTDGFTVTEPPFTDISASLTGVDYSSVAWGDYDSDGDLDILLTGRYFSKVYRNDGGSFVDISAPLTGVIGSSVAWGDYDNDGDLDILLTGHSSSANVSRVYRNDSGTFVDITASLPGVQDGSVAWGDYDNDGDLDVLLTGYTGSTRISRVYRNDNGSFVIGASLYGVHYSSVAWGDYDNDGDLDILLTGYTGSTRISKVYRNDNGSFVDAGASLYGIQYGSIAWGDYDSDGDLDILLSGYMGAPTTRVYTNSGGNFYTVAAPIPVFFSSVAWGDYDNDGDLDILLTGTTNGNPTGSIAKVYRNDNGSFVDAAVPLTSVFRSSVAWGDYDNDRDLDILLTGYSSSGPVSKVYRNNITIQNTVPSAPANLASSVLGNSVTLSWNKSTDNETSQNGLTYNLRLGTTSGGVEEVPPMADGNTGYRKVVQLGNTNHDSSWTINNLADGTYYWSAQAIDNAFAGSPFATEKSFSIPETPTVLLETKIFLEGPYDSANDEMTTGLNSGGPIPTTSPYAEDSRIVTSIPADITDWVLVQLRSTTDGSALASKSAFLHKDGRIVADDGTTGQITMNAANGDYYIVIKHRNHLAVMSANPVTLSSGSSTLYDFTTGSNKYYGTGGAKELEPGVWGMWSGDINQDGQTTTADFTQWFNSARAGDSGYQTTDINLDAQVTTSDFTKWFNNARAGAASKVP